MQPNSDQLYYRPSGAAPIVGLILTLVLGVVAAVILAFVYAYLIQYNPFLYVNFLATLGFGFALGLAGSAGVKAGKVRAPAIAALLGLVVGLVAVYVSWVAWMHALGGRVDEELWLYLPNQLWHMIGFIAAEGAWSLKSYTPTGAVLWGIWAVEALIVVGFAVFLAMTAAGEPFCEDCGQWTVDESIPCALPMPEDTNALRERLEAGNMAALARLAETHEDSPSFTTAQVAVCEKCGNTAFLTLTANTPTVNKKGEVENKEDAFVEHLRLTGASLRDVRRLPEHVEHARQDKEDAA